MKIYLRLLNFCHPLGKRLIPYSICAILASLFGVLNFSLLIPLLNVLFGSEAKNIEKLLIEPTFSFSIKYLIDLFNYNFAQTIRTRGEFAALLMVTASVVVSVMLHNLFKYFSSVEIELFKLQAIRNIRNAVFEKLLKMPLGYFSNQRKGDLMVRLTNDIQEVENVVVSTLSVVFKEPIALIAFFIYLLSMSVKLTLFSLAVIPISGIIISFFTKKLKKAATEGFESFGRLMGIIDETLSAMRVIKAFNGEKFTFNKYRHENDTYTYFMKKINLKRELASPFSEFSGVLVVSFILLYGGSLVLSNNSELSASEFVAYIVVFSQILRPAKAISGSFTQVQRGLAAGERVLEIVDLEITVHNEVGAKPINSFEKSIEFRNVSFAYEDKLVLKNMSFTIERGKTIALVGPSGGGKTTISDLFPRFYDPKEGQILIDCIDLKQLDIHSLRNLMGIVTQESILFNDTIFNNITYGLDNVPEEEVIKAAKIANAHEFIIKTDNQYQTYVGDRGVKLSGGQKQRICIARAILKNPPIMILDEATSALDTESEKLVQNALDNLMKNRTSLVIAHRLSTIQNADEILVIKDGEIIERGTHEQLSAVNGGLYQKLQTMQSI